MTTENIRRVWCQVDAIDYREGLVAYRRYRGTLERLAAHYGAPLSGTVAAFCALSPNNDYMGNLRSTVTLLRAYREGVPVNKVHVSTYNACRNRAWRFLNGENFLDITRGPKTRAFFLSILNPDDPHPITIDGHMVNAWRGEVTTMVEVAWSKFKYDVVANDYRAFAAEIGVLPNQLQAMIWFTWKRINNIVYRPQLNLFRRADDLWGLDLSPSEIQPFFPFI